MLPVRRVSSPAHLKKAPGRPRVAVKAPRKPAPKPPRAFEEPIWFIDGEGQGSSPHVYTFLAAACEDGQTLQTRFASDGLSTLECLDFLMSIPTKRVYGYSLGYDWTMILANLAQERPKDVWSLVHEESREFDSDGPGSRKARRKILYAGYGLDWLNGQVTLYSGRYAKKKWRYRLAVWDVFRFFGARFTSALESWGIATKERLEEMSRMKAERARFDQLSPREIQAYCLEECVFGAKLVRGLLSAHVDVGLPLRSFFGPGSTAKVLLNSLGVKESLVRDEDLPAALKHAISCAFFGGRFEISKAGPIERPVYTADIASAYPYQISQLPCLTCGKWERTKSQARIESATLAVVKCQAVSREPHAWGTLPWRSSKGAILFPTKGDVTYVWRNEYLSALKCRGDIKLHEAWVYHCDCEHNPFQKFPHFYSERLRLGSSDRGLTLKLGLNSGYGVMVQRKGSRRFRSLVWAGNVTSGTRAMILDVLSKMRNPWDLLMTATDAVYSLEPLKLPSPIDLGTNDSAKRAGKAPLGGWDQKVIEKGMFLLRSGVYFPMHPTEKDLKECRARGLSRVVLYRHAEKILDHWRKNAKTGRLPPDYMIDGDERRFIGLRGAFSIDKSGPKLREENGDYVYGEWLPFKPTLSYDPFPKRMTVLDDYHLLPWHGMKEGSTTPYDPDLKDPETIKIEQAIQIADDQPNGDVE